MRRGKESERCGSVTSKHQRRWFPVNTYNYRHVKLLSNDDNQQSIHILRLVSRTILPIAELQISTLPQEKVRRHAAH